MCAKKTVNNELDFEINKAIFKVSVCSKCKGYVTDPTGVTLVNRICPTCGIPCKLSKKWCVRRTHKGKSAIVRVNADRKKAFDYWQGIQTDRSRGVLNNKEKLIHWDDAESMFLRETKVAQISGNTDKSYKRGLTHLKTYFGKWYLQDIENADLMDYRDTRLEVVQPVTVYEEMRLLLSIFKLMCSTYSADPTRGNAKPMLHAVYRDLQTVKKPSVDNKRGETHYFAKEEYMNILENTDLDYLRLIVKLGVGTGLRIQNIQGLKWSQVDLSDEGKITFKKNTTKSKRVFICCLMPSLIQELRDWRAQQDPKTIYVFPSALCPDKPLSNVRGSWKTLLEKLGYTDRGFGFHILRHTFASLFLMGGGDLATLSRLMDHASIKITFDLYGHLSMHHKRKAIHDYEKALYGDTVLVPPDLNPDPDEPEEEV